MGLRWKNVVRHFQNDSGQALVEFALVLPILLLVLLGMLDFGKGMNYWIDETHLANEGVRFAAVNRNPGAGTLQDYILSQADTNELRSGGSSSLPSRAQVCISFPNGTTSVGDPVRVTMSADYHWMYFFSHVKYFGTPLANITTRTITGEATMRLEARPTNYSAGCTT
jgi:Flp pilus assembly protein TadG